MYSKIRESSFLFTAITLIGLSGCGSYNYIPDNISNIETDKLCGIGRGLLYFDELKIDDYLYGSSRIQGITTGFYVRPGVHQISGFFQEQLPTGNSKISANNTTVTDIISQRPKSYTSKAITLDSVLKDPGNQETTGPFGIGYSLVWYTINLECKANTNTLLGEIILFADQFLKRSVSN